MQHSSTGRGDDVTIAELEARSGMTRANIRFYESEGFLSPARRENGYRDYSEADLKLLLRLKLLRALDLPLSEILRLQRGELGLAAAMERHAGQLALERRELSSSEAVCRDIMLSGENFESLDVQRWLGELETGAVPPEEDAEPKLICPWRRYFARTLDYLLCEQLLLTPIMLIARPNVDLSGVGVSVALTVGAIALMLLLEPLCLHYFGTTPGKRLLGLYVERPDGGRLSFGEAARRTFDVLSSGLGFYVPILSQVLLILSWQKHREGRSLSWEAGSELRLRRKHQGLLIAVYAAAVCLVLFLGFINEQLSQMPKNRGDISAAEFCENYNGLAHMDGYLRSYISLTPEGWERSSENSTRLELMGYEAEYSLYETEGVLEKLELRIESIPGRVSLNFPTQELELALRGSVWGREGSGVLDFYERSMQLVDIERLAAYGGLYAEDFRLELPSAAVTCELNGWLGSELELLMTIELL